jgi:hypothetical protein
VCQDLTILIEDDDSHYITQCEHGTVHVVWGHMSFNLRRDDFVSLADTAVGACLQAGIPPDSKASAFRLHIDDAMVSMEAETFWQFADLLRRAVEEMPPDVQMRIERGAEWTVEIISNLYAPQENVLLN